jgi:hypothetical protein
MVCACKAEQEHRPFLWLGLIFIRRYEVESLISRFKYQKNLWDGGGKSYRNPALVRVLYEIE